jgi:hypothetical protein
MAKRRGKRKELSPRVPKPTKLATSIDGHVIAIVSILCALFFAGAAIIVVWSFFDLKTRYLRPSWLTYSSWAVWILIMILIGKLMDRAGAVAKTPLTAMAAKTIRQNMILVLTLEPFFVLVTAMPALKAHGQVTRFSDWLLSWLSVERRASDNLSLAVAFTAGALVSGIIGNGGYDLLRFVIKKLMAKKIVH